MEGSLQCLLGDGVCARRAVPHRALGELQVPEYCARLQRRHAPGLGLGSGPPPPPPPLQSCAGRPWRGGCRARAGGGCGAAGDAGAETAGEGTWAHLAPALL